MASREPGRLTASERVSLLGNTDSKVCIAHELFPICLLNSGKRTRVTNLSYAC